MTDIAETIGVYTPTMETDTPWRDLGAALIAALGIYTIIVFAGVSL
ncbi:hypothetical protein [Corynebacterium sp. A21]